MKLKEDVLKIDCEKVSEKIQKFIQEKTKELKRDGVIFGLSGGVDSTVVATLCSRAVGKDKVLGLLMPEKEGNPMALKDGEFVADWLGIKTKLVDITPELETIGIYDFIFSKIPTRKLKEKATHFWYKQFGKKYGENPFLYSLEGVSDKLIAKGIAHFKVKHRMRMVLIYFYGETNNLLVAGAAHLSEDMTGLFSKFGIDHNADIMPLGNLYRTQILQLAKYFQIPERILDKPPSPDIIPGVEDKYAYLIGLPSEKVDLVLFGLENGLASEEISKQTEVPISKVNYIKELMRRSSHMRHPPMTPDL
jgi:NAD+ synthase